MTTFKAGDEVLVDWYKEPCVVFMESPIAEGVYICMTPIGSGGGYTIARDSEMTKTGRNYPQVREVIDDYPTHEAWDIKEALHNAYLRMTSEGVWI